MFIWYAELAGLEPFLNAKFAEYIMNESNALAVVFASDARNCVRDGFGKSAVGQQSGSAAT
jgi:hypothetical protein